MDKKSFVVYHDLLETLQFMPEEMVGKLFMTMLRYSANGEALQPTDPLFYIFNPIKLQIDRDKSKYQTIVQKRKEAGKKSAAEREKMKEQISTLANTSKHMSINSTDNDNATVNGNGNGNVNDNESEINNKGAQPGMNEKMNGLKFYVQDNIPGADERFGSKLKPWFTNCTKDEFIDRVEKFQEFYPPLFLREFTDHYLQESHLGGFTIHHQNNFDMETKLRKWWNQSDMQKKYADVKSHNVKKI